MSMAKQRRDPVPLESVWIIRNEQELTMLAGGAGPESYHSPFPFLRQSTMSCLISSEALQFPRWLGPALDVIHQHEFWRADFKVLQGPKPSATMWGYSVLAGLSERNKQSKPANIGTTFIRVVQRSAYCQQQTPLFRRGIKTR